MKIIPIPAPTDDAPLEPWVPFDHIDDERWGGVSTGLSTNTAGYVQGTFMAPGGTRFFIYEELSTDSIDGGSGNLHILELATPFDFGSRTSELATLIVSRAQDINFSNDGLHMYALTWTETGVGAAVVQYDLSVAWDVFTRTEMGTFIIPDIVQGYTRSYLRNMDISEDGRRIYLLDPTVTVFANNPSSSKGALFVYELTTPYDITTAVEHSLFVIADSYIDGQLILDMTVWSRGHHVDQIALAGAKMISFNYPDGLVDKYVKEGGLGNLTSENHQSLRVLKFDRGRYSRTTLEGTGSGQQYVASIYTTEPG